MSEITKLYENAGVEKCNSTLKYIIPNICLKECEEETYKCKDCEYFEYPPFTAEKQIELIKWLIKYDELHADFNDNEYGFSTLNYSGKYKKDFEESLASVINNELWVSLTEEEKRQVKGILE